MQINLLYLSLSRVYQVNMRWFLLLILSASAVWAQPLGADYRQTFDFTAAPLILTPGGAPLMLNVDYGEQFASYEDVVISITFQNATKHITTRGLLLSNQAAPPSYASATEWGYAVMTGSSSSVTPSTSFSWNSGYGSEHWFNVGASEIAQELLDGQFTFFFQNAPLSQSPGLTSKEDLVVVSAEVVLRGAVLAPEPTPTPTPTPAPTSDADNDGVNYYREIADGTNPTNATSFNPLSKGLVVYYPLNNSLLDQSGNSNDLANPSPGITFASGLPWSAGAAVLLSSRAAAVSSERPLGIVGNQPHTIAFWLFLPEPSFPSWSAGEGTLLTLGGEGDGKGSQLWSDDIAEGGGRIVAGGNYADMELRNLGDAFLGKWQHVAYVYDGAVSGSKIYLNSSQTLLVPWPGGNHTDVKDLPSTPLTMGQSSIGPAAAPGAKIAYARVYDRALSSEEVRRLFYTEAFTDFQKSFLYANPSILGHFSQADYNANRTNGQTDVTTNPSAFNLFTQSQFDGNRTAGQQDVIASPMTYGLYDSNSIMDLRMGGLMIQKQNNQAVVVFRIQTTTNLATQPFTNYGMPLTNLIVMPEKSGFCRIEASAGAVYVDDPNQVPPTIEPDPTPTPTPSAP